LQRRPCDWLNDPRALRAARDLAGESAIYSVVPQLKRLLALRHLASLALRHRTHCGTRAVQRGEAVHDGD
jgi:hypothetical protein